MSPRLRGAISMLSIIVTWAALVGAVGYWQNHHKHPAAEPALIHTGIEKRAKVITDTYRPMTEAEMHAWCEREHGDYRGGGSCTFTFFAHNASDEGKEVTVKPEWTDANGNRVNILPLKASKLPCGALKSTKQSHRAATKHKSHRTPTIAAPEEYHDGASQWSRDHPGPIPNSGTSVPSSGHGGGHHSGGHAGGHHHHSPPSHHPLC